MKQQLQMTKNPAKTNPYFQIAMASIMLFFFFGANLIAQTTGENYIKTTTYKKPFSQSQQDPSPDKAMVEITYIDGLGRPKQKIAHKQSGNGDDLITHIVYDGFGRQPKEFLPYERNSSLVFDTNGESSTTSFYSNPINGPTTSNPYSQKLFENSALNRVLKQAAPGDDWAMAPSGGHEVEFAYETNTASEVSHFAVNLSSNDPQLQYKGKYPGGHLYKNVTKDENWQPADGNKGTMVQYTDKMGRMVLKRTFDSAIGPTGTIALDTYYIYDVYGNLTFVLPPKLSAQIPASGYIPLTLLDALAYQYKYDHRNRMIAKRIPGKHKEFMVYDVLDRLIATGPALSPFGDGQEGWLRTKYDIFNRVVFTFWKLGVATQQEQVNLSEAPPTYISETRLSGNNTNTVNGVDFSYTNNVSPSSGYHILNVNYYDDYGYKGHPANIPSTVAEGESQVYYNNTSKKPKGLPTGSWVRAMETAGLHNAITSYSLYDNKARPIRVKSTNPTNGYTQADTKYNFIGNPLKTITKHKKNAVDTELVVTETYSYTPQSRPLRHTHKIGNGTPQLLALNHYDALGRLEYKKVGGPHTFGATPLQKVDYRYNVRGWLTDINNTAKLAQPNDPQDLFAFKINYTEVDNDINGTVIPLYNGNIAETFWRTSSDNIKRKYGYNYDYGNRLLDAYYQLPGTSVPLAESYSTHYSYDRNGNILSLQRNGEQDIASTVIAIDDLVYTYDGGNQLKKVNDSEHLSAGFDMGNASTSDQFGYDSYGNMITDPYKNITNITYNHLNLPTKITFGTGNKIEYFYDATGIKLKKKATDGSTITTTQYMDGFQYNAQGRLDFFPTSEGYVKAIVSGSVGTTSYGFRYVFNYVDHLGNIRLSYAEDPQNNHEVSILEENHYYPYGLKHKGYNGDHRVFIGTPGGSVTLTPVNPFLGDSYKYKFGGMEYQDEFDINTYDFGARNYDPALGRWMNIDPLAEAMRRHSPYNYAFDNPVYFIDPDGMMSLPFGGGGTGSLESYDFGSGGGGSSGEDSDGIYIDKQGNKVGEDSKGASDGRVYVVDGSSKREVERNTAGGKTTETSEINKYAELPDNATKGEEQKMVDKAKGDGTREFGYARLDYENKESLNQHTEGDTYKNGDKTANVDPLKDIPYADRAGATVGHMSHTHNVSVQPTPSGYPSPNDKQAVRNYPNATNSVHNTRNNTVHVMRAAANGNVYRITISQNVYFKTTY